MRKNLTGQFQMETLDKATKARLEAAVLQRDLIPFFPPPLRSYQIFIFRTDSGAGFGNWRRDGKLWER